MRRKKIVLNDKELLSMYRCFLYTKMGVRNEETPPTDKQCLDWLQRVMAQAEHRVEPPLLIAARPDVECAPIKGSGGKHRPDIKPIIKRFDFFCGLPDWRDQLRKVQP